MLNVDQWVFRRHAAQFLSTDQLRALGCVAVEFGILEAALGSHAARLLKLRVPFTVLTGGATARRHAEILRECLGRYLGGGDNADLAEPIAKVLSRVIDLADKRNDLLHAAWGNFIDPCGQSLAQYAADNGYPREQGRKLRPFSTTAETIQALADEIADVRYELNKLMMNVEIKAEWPKDRWPKGK